MAQIDHDLIQKLRKKLGVGRSRLYQIIQKKISQTHLDRHLAALVIASENGISIQKYASSEDLAAIRGAPISSYGPKKNISPQIVQRKVIESDPLRVNIDFVSNKNLRRILERDIAELSLARSQGLGKTAKTCIVLSGSIAEALLLSALKKRSRAALAIASSFAKPLCPDMEQWNLYDMVKVASSMSPALLPTDADTGADQLRQWRNLIHPGRELRDMRSKRIQPTSARARNAISFLQFISEELSKKGV